MELDIKLVLGIASAVVAFVNYLPYLIGVVRQTLHPHAFSWIIFTIITATISVAQLTEGAGAGAWATGATSITTFLIACFALRNGGYRITRSDKLSFVGALIAIPAWIITANPLVAVIILTGIEALGFMPTYRKAWLKPHDESILAFSLTILKYLLALGAMQSYTLTTVLFPIALLILSGLLIVELVARKRVVAR
ncbi:MAG TPA: hypothetical protein VKP88_03695 [Candidatus Paceibacterota bacterium]|nr:hypothetical protein [Candidatus Paceibacterota bacterium]